VATLSFEGETHAQIVAKVKRWLGSLEGEEELLSPTEAVARTAELAKDALRVIASSGPGPVAQSDLVKGLTAMGYRVTDTTSKALIDALDSLSSVTGEQVVKRVRRRGAEAMFEMNRTVAERVLKRLGRRRP
jgi:hypothetical protein